MNSNEVTPSASWIEEQRAELNVTKVFVACFGPALNTEHANVGLPGWAKFEMRKEIRKSVIIMLRVLFKERSVIV